MILAIVHLEDIKQICDSIPKTLSAFKGTIKVHQVIFQVSSPGLLTEIFSCFDCILCDKFKIGSLITTTEEELEAIEEEIECHVLTEDPAALSNSPSTKMNHQEPIIIPSKNANDHSPSFLQTTVSETPEVGKYVIGHKRGMDSIYYIDEVLGDQLQVLPVTPFDRTFKNHFKLDVTQKETLKSSDVHLILPVPKTKIVKNKVVREFLFVFKNCNI